MRNLKLVYIFINWLFGETFFVNSFEDIDKQINFSSEQCVDFKSVNGKIKKIAAAAQC